MVRATALLSVSLLFLAIDSFTGSVLMLYQRAEEDVCRKGISVARSVRWVII